MGDLTIETVDHLKTVIRLLIHRFDPLERMGTISPLVSHGIQDPVSISTFGSDGLERYKLWNFIGVVLKNLITYLFEFGAGCFYYELDLAIDDELFLPVIDGLNAVNNVYAGCQTSLYECCGQVRTDLLRWTGHQTDEYIPHSSLIEPIFVPSWQGD
jgi:hypothetical protein